jgi:serine/threonine-protein kinase
MAADSRFCAFCGAAADSGVRMTQTVATQAAAISHPSRAPGQGRFASGAMMGGRYRIVAMLGKGGMGEVYRADDLTLEQPVALKFLPPAWSRNVEALARFRNEVRMARQVSHPNVCRVYDLVETGGQCFLSMEYVDGEDLGSLLRRIGRLPTDKALEIARKLCAGLNAAHEKGVLHRDLKPGNIMLDARGQVLLTDFGLAGLAGRIEGGDVTSGTPAYMAPEQLSGEEVTVRSDIYSLGLVLYEIFTGKLPFESDTLAGLQRARLETSPESPSTLVRELDPVIERVILRCLQAKPALRPPSALAVAAALPGGDPLAAALAAGETPSPEMVAAAGEGAGLSPSGAIGLFAAILAGLAVICGLAARMNPLQKIATPYSTEVLSQKARDVVQRLGYTNTVDEAYDYSWYTEFRNWVQQNDKPKPRWSQIVTQQPALFRFWFRQSPVPMTAGEFHNDLLVPGVVTNDDPPITTDGMTYVELDCQGRLMYFEARPPQLLEPLKAPLPPPDWNRLFTEAGLDAAQLTPAEPLWTWLSTTDARAAWTGVWPGTMRPLRVEAAALRGKPVGFYLTGPWSKPWRTPAPPSTGGQARLAIMAVLALVVCLVPPVLARKNLLRGRGDQRSAFRLGAFLFFVQMALWLTSGHMTLSAGTFGMFLIAICTSVFAGVLMWTVYLALEPYVRRNWPQTLIASTSLLGGRAQDPVVGRDVLAGVAMGVLWSLINLTVNWWLRDADPSPMLVSTDAMLGLRPTLAMILTFVPYSARNTLLFFFLLFLLRVLLRKQWAAAAVFAAIFAVMTSVNSQDFWIALVVGLVIWGSRAFMVLRWGLLSLATGLLTNDLLLNVPVTTHTSAWYFGNTLFMLAVVVVLAAWAMRTSIQSRRVWMREWFA